MAQQKHATFLNQAKAGKNNKTPDYWNTFMNECLTFRFHDFVTKPTKHNQGLLRQLNQLHFGSGVGQDRLVRCVLFFTVNAPDEFDSSKTVRIGQIKEGNDSERYNKYVGDWKAHCSAKPDWVDAAIRSGRAITRGQGLISQGSTTQKYLSWNPNA